MSAEPSRQFDFNEIEADWILNVISCLSRQSLWDSFISNVAPSTYAQLIGLVKKHSIRLWYLIRQEKLPEELLVECKSLRIPNKRSAPAYQGLSSSSSSFRLIFLLFFIFEIATFSQFRC